MVSLFYVSRSLIEGNAFQAAALSAILATARRNNAADGITGALLLDEGQFLQVLEGERQTVKRRFDAICGDPRHTDIQLIGESPLGARRFSDWNMAYLGAARAKLALGGVSIDELRRMETHRAADVLDAMLNLAVASDHADEGSYED